MAAMSSVALAGAALAAAGSVAGGIISSNGAAAAGSAAGQAGMAALQNARAEGAQARSYASPWYETGKAAQNALANHLGLGYLRHDPNQLERGGVRIEGDPVQGRKDAMAGFEFDPGYLFRQREGVNALDRSAASRGLLRSGAQQKGITKFGQDLASEEYGAHLDRLFRLSGLGAGVVGPTNAAATGVAGQGNALNFQGQMARASSYADSANALASGISKGVENLASGMSYGFGSGWF